MLTEGHSCTHVPRLATLLDSTGTWTEFEACTYIEIINVVCRPQDNMHGVGWDVPWLIISNNGLIIITFTSKVYCTNCSHFWIICPQYSYTRWSAHTCINVWDISSFSETLQVDNSNWKLPVSKYRIAVSSRQSMSTYTSYWRHIVLHILWWTRTSEFCSSLTDTDHCGGTQLQAVVYHDMSHRRSNWSLSDRWGLNNIVSHVGMSDLHRYTQHTLQTVWHCIRAPSNTPCYHNTSGNLGKTRPSVYRTNDVLENEVAPTDYEQQVVDRLTTCHLAVQPMSRQQN
jgi:hypothetical protein